MRCLAGRFAGRLAGLAGSASVLRLRAVRGINVQLGQRRLHAAAADPLFAAQTRLALRGIDVLLPPEGGAPTLGLFGREVVPKPVVRPGADRLGSQATR